MFCQRDNYDYNLVPLCRMMRAWKSKWGVPIGGLLIDTLCYQFIENYQYRDKSYFYYDYLCRDCFKWMSEQDARSRNIGKLLAAVNMFTARACSNTRPRGATTFHSKRSSTRRRTPRGNGQRSRAGERSLEPHSQTDDTPQSRAILEGQLREAYGRVVYSHKTHEKCADILLARQSAVQIVQIVLSAITTGGLIAAITGADKRLAVIGLIVSSCLVALNS